jgi:LysM repeat protein
VATTPAAGITPYGTTSFVTPIFTPVPIISRPASYTLAAGEFPYCIARRFNVNQTELLNMNNLASAELYQPGMVRRRQSLCW